MDIQSRTLVDETVGDGGPGRFAWMSHVHTSGEEWVNGLTHGLGFVLSLIGSVVFFWSCLHKPMSWNLLACAVFCLALLGVYGASALSHFVKEPTWRHRFRCWDQGLIFLLIAATYWPLSAFYLSGWWNSLTATMWIVGLYGFLTKVVHAHRVDKITVIVYVVMGWLPVLALPVLWQSSPRLAMLILAGGVVYSAGAVILMNDHRRPYLHAVWHLLVILGSGIHFWAVFRYASPAW